MAKFAVWFIYCVIFDYVLLSLLLVSRFLFSFSVCLFLSLSLSLSLWLSLLFVSLFCPQIIHQLSLYIYFSGVQQTATLGGPLCYRTCWNCLGIVLVLFPFNCIRASHGYCFQGVSGLP